MKRFFIVFALLNSLVIHAQFKPSGTLVNIKNASTKAAKDYSLVVVRIANFPLNWVFKRIPALASAAKTINGMFFLKAPTNVAEPCTIQAETIAIASKLLTLVDAEKIMGEPAKLTCNSFIKKGDNLVYKCDYTSIPQEATAGKTGKPYFMYEIYGGVAAAANAYAAIYQANRNHGGIEVVSGLGSEACHHSDQTHFYFFLVRKNEKMIRLKLNKVTSGSSEKEFKEATRRIVDRL